MLLVAEAPIPPEKQSLAHRPFHRSQVWGDMLSCIEQERSQEQYRQYSCLYRISKNRITFSKVHSQRCRCIQIVEN